MKYSPIFLLLILLYFSISIFTSGSTADASFINDHTVNRHTKILSSTPNKQYQLHDVGKIALTVTNFGTIGTGALAVPICDGEICPSCEYPKDSDIEYLDLGAIWVGAVVGQDTLVSVGADGWLGSISEFLPDTGNVGTIIARSDNPSSPYFSPDAVSNFDVIATYTDTFTDPSLTGTDPFDGRNHVPLYVGINQTSYSWAADSVDDFILFEYHVENIGEMPLSDAWIGIFINSDIGHNFQAYVYKDDISGFRRTSRFPEGYCIAEDSANLAWTADNDGDPSGESWYYKSSGGVMGLKMHGVFPEPDQYNFNWWISNNNAAFDFGPRLAGTLEDPFRSFGAHLGTPTGDLNKYYLLSHQEFDYDQLFTAIDHSYAGFLPPPSPSMASDFADGYDTRYLMSFGPFNLDVGDSVVFYYSVVMAEDFHVAPEDFSNNFDPLNPYIYYNLLNFDNFGNNARWADWTYDNPGVDTDGDGDLGKFCWDYDGVSDEMINEFGGYIRSAPTKFYYEGDGVPDIRYRIPNHTCGDANADGSVNVGDDVFLINYIFHDGPAPNPVESGDANCDGNVNVGDDVYLINYIFKPGSPAPCETCP